MALLKTIELQNGVVVNYHRIVSINKITNHSTRLEITSYISKEKRELVSDLMDDEDAVNVYAHTEYVLVDYDETSNIKDWYGYLKTTEKYKDAEDA